MIPRSTLTVSQRKGSVLENGYTLLFSAPWSTTRRLSGPAPSVGSGAFRIQSWKGMTFKMQASTDLDQWSPLTTVTNLTRTLEFVDPNAVSQGHAATGRWFGNPRPENRS